MAIWRVTCGGSIYNSEKWANVFHVDGGLGFNHAALLDAFETVYSQPASGGGTAWLTPCPGDVAPSVVGVTLDSLSLQAIDTPAIPEVRQVLHKGGQNTPGGLPVDVALVVSWRTSLAGRSFRGRTYLPPFHENQNDDTAGSIPHPSGSVISGLAVNAHKLLTDLLTVNTPLVVYSRKLKNAKTVTGGFIDSSWDTQRRRGQTINVARTLFAGP